MSSTLQHATKGYVLPPVTNGYQEIALSTFNYWPNLEQVALGVFIVNAVVQSTDDRVYILVVVLDDYTELVSLDFLRFSTAGPAGPWTSCTPIPSDPYHAVFPVLAAPAGKAFFFAWNMIADIGSVFNGSVWFDIKMTDLSSDSSGDTRGPIALEWPAPPTSVTTVPYAFVPTGAGYPGVMADYVADVVTGPGGTRGLFWNPEMTPP